MNNDSIHYSVTVLDPSGHRLAIRLSIPQPEPTGQRLFMPAWIPGSYLIRDFARQVESITAHSGHASVPVRKISNHHWQCAPCAGPLTLDYVVYAWDLSVRSAHVDEHHAFFNGTSVFLGVEEQTHRPCLVELCPPSHTNDWRVYTSLTPAQEHPKSALEHGFGMYRAPDYDALIDHPIEMGTPQTIAFTAHGAQHEMVFTGVAPNLDLERIAADTKKICEAQMALFQPDAPSAPFLDSSPRYVFLTLITGNGYGGLEHRASTALLTSRHHLPVRGREPGPEYQDFLGLVSHEYFHTWHVKRIKPAAFAPYHLTQENHTRLLWVFEGFTSYYDELMLLRSGVISQEDYLKRLAKTITQVMRGPGRLKQSVADSSFDAWTRFYKQDENSPNALVSYYSKGALIALALDMTIQQASDRSKSLDDVMRLLWQRYGRRFYERDTQPQGVDEEGMADLIREATGVDVHDFLRRYVEGCEDLPLEALLEQQGLRLQKTPSTTIPSLDVRLRQQNSGLELATVYEHGAAHEAGLSAGDVLLALGGLRVSDDTSLKRVLAAWQPSDLVPVHVFRRDELRSFTVCLGEPDHEYSLVTIKDPLPESACEPHHHAHSTNIF